ncbi:MAG: hypothetical protein ACXAC7_04280 [Candidatus Hodarchaeales archaeon]|jgi:hypothetical protein
MSPVSPEMLRQLYKKKSLKNITNGFSLELTNPLSDATILKPAKVTIGKEKFKDFELEINDEKFKNTEVSERNPFMFKVKSSAKLIFSRAEPLPVGKYEIIFKITSEEYGELKFSIKDRIRE